MAARELDPQPVVPGELRPGDRVRVRSAEEILATLDETGACEGVPFMPEMIGYVGRTFTVYKRLEKICDYFGEQTRSRRMTGTVLLDDVRCDGSGHGGCEAECRIFWKEVWLERAPSEAASEAEGAEALAERLTQTTSRSDPDSGDILYRCQATEAVGASEPMGELGPGQYVREVRVGNVGVLELASVGTRALARKLAVRLKLRSHLPIRLAGADRIDGERLDLEPGEWVRVRSAEEIGRTLNDAAVHRGLMFTLEMVPTCGHRYRVRRRVNRLIDERTGSMRELRNDCIALDGVVCTGRLTPGAWFCPREHLPLYREAWLERCEPPGADS